MRLIIRPPRSAYELAALGPESFPFRGQGVAREDCSTTNARGERLVYSIWRAAARGGAEPAAAVPHVIYVHGNSSSRAEALGVLTVCLSLGCAVVALDCAGSGRSGGEHVTLGLREAADVAAVARALSAGARGAAAPSRLALWGRSMGASAALLHGRGDGPRRVACVVADSAFACLEALCAHHARRAAPRAPDALVRLALRRARAGCRRRAGFDLADVAPARAGARARAGGAFAACCTAPPLLLVHGADDEVVPLSQAREVEARYAGACELVLAPGGHDARRPAAVLRRARAFLAEHLLGDGPGGRREHDEEEGVLFSTDVPPWALGRAQGNDFEEVGDEEDDSPVAGFEEGGGLPRDPFATYDDADVFAAALDIDRAPDGGYGGLSFEI